MCRCLPVLNLVLVAAVNTSLRLATPSVSIVLPSLFHSTRRVSRWEWLIHHQQNFCGCRLNIETNDSRTRHLPKPSNSGHVNDVKRIISNLRPQNRSRSGPTAFRNLPAPQTTKNVTWKISRNQAKNVPNSFACSDPFVGIFRKNPTAANPVVMRCNHLGRYCTEPWSRLRTHCAEFYDSIPPGPHS